MNNIRKKKNANFPLANWGEPGAPLLPESLRLAWADEPLPLWVIEEMGLPKGCTLAVLDSHAWEYGLKTLSPRLMNFLINLVYFRRRDIEQLPVFIRPWPATLSPFQLPWRTRTRNCLEKSGLLADRLELSRLTYKNLLDIRAMGVMSVLDFASTAEAAMNQHSDTRDRLVTVLESSWANQVSEQDPRFCDLLPPSEGTVFERVNELTGQPIENLLEEQWLAQAIPAIEARIEEIESLTLDEVVEQFLHALSGYSGAKHEALLARLGWSGSAPITLEEAGRIAGVSKERLRQIQKRVEDRMPNHPILMPALDRAINTLAEQAPIDAEKAAHLLMSEGISSKPYSPLSILEIAKACGRKPPFDIEDHHGRSIVVTNSHGKNSNSVLSIAYRQAVASGATNIAEVVAEALSLGISTNEEAVREILEVFPDVQFLEDSWFWYRKGKKGWNPLRSYTRKMLSVVSPMNVTAIREGLRREYRFRAAQKPRKWYLIVPPRAVLRSFLRSHPEFEIDELDEVTSVVPLDYRKELSATEQIFVDVIRTSPASVLDRSSYARRCIERGMNQHTFSVYLTYSAVIAHLGTDIWTLRGMQVESGTVEALRAANAERPREKRVLDYGWTPEGCLWVAVRLPDLRGLAAFTFGIPAPIRRLVAEREFPASSESGIPSGTIRINEDGQSWGYGPFLARNGADEGDLLIVEFSLSEQTAILRLGDDELLESLSP